MTAAIPEFFRELLALPPEGSTVAGKVDWLHLLVIGTTMAGSFGLAAFAYFWLVRYKRKRPGQLTRHVVPSLTGEILLSSGTLGLFLVFWLIGYFIYLDMREPPPENGTLVVYVTAKQWMWKFSYPDGRSTNNVLVAPEGQTVKLVMTSRDVIHSFYVPGFRVKQDVLPGRYVMSWFRSEQRGRYPIFCAEYCGVSHSNMRGEVVILSRRDYAKWTGQEERAGDEKLADLAEYGQKVATRHECFACHTVDGQPHVGPTWSRLYDSWVDLEGGARVLADDAYLTRSMMEPMAEVVRGYKSVMPTYYGRLTHPEVAALVAYIRALKDGPLPPLIALPALGVTPKDAGPFAPLLGTEGAGPHDAGAPAGSEVDR